MNSENIKVMRKPSIFRLIRRTPLYLWVFRVVLVFMGLEVCGISCITNLAAGLSKQELNHKEVQETADRVAKSFKELVTEIVVNM